MPNMRKFALVVVRKNFYCIFIFIVQNKLFFSEKVTNFGKMLIILIPKPLDYN